MWRGIVRPGGPGVGRIGPGLRPRAPSGPRRDAAASYSRRPPCPTPRRSLGAYGAGIGPASGPAPETLMLHYAVVFFVIALIAALFGFGGIAASAAGIAQLLFLIFIVLAVATFVVDLLRTRR